MQDARGSALWQERVVGLAIASGAWIALTSEALSAARALTRGWVALLWLAAAAAVVLVFRRQRVGAKASTAELPRGDPLARAVFMVVLVEVAILLLIALVAPPTPTTACSITSVEWRTGHRRDLCSSTPHPSTVSCGCRRLPRWPSCTCTFWQAAIGWSIWCSGEAWS